MSDWDSVLEGLARDAESALWPEGSKNWQADRSEEHTSELQSRLHLVCRLLLEKKKKNNRRARRGPHTHTRRHRPLHARSQGRRLPTRPTLRSRPPPGTPPASQRAAGDGYAPAA